MRSEQEIKDKLAKLYDSKNKFIELSKKEPYPSKALQQAFDMVEQVYDEKIEILLWVLINYTDNE